MDRDRKGKMEYSPKTRFIASLLRGVGLTLTLLLVWHVILSGLISYQHEKNLERRLLVSDKISDIIQYEIRQEKLTNSQARLDFITTLRRQNDMATRILRELGKASPGLIDLNLVKWQDRTIWIEGYAYSNLELATWVDNIKKTVVSMQPVITSMGDKNQQRYFKLQIGLK